MTDHKSIAAALAAAQSEMGKALKESNNPHFRSKYADLGNVMDACMPALSKNGIALIQPTGEDEGGRYVETVLLHTSGESLRCRVPLIVQKNDMQGYGSAVTYARRYGLMAMAGIAPEDDDGNAAAKAAPPKQSPAPRQQPAPDHSEAVTYLQDADTLAELADRWGKLPKEVQRIPAVISAKDARKAELTPEEPGPSAANEIDDEIPHQ